MRAERPADAQFAPRRPLVHRRRHPAGPAHDQLEGALAAGRGRDRNRAPRPRPGTVTSTNWPGHVAQRPAAVQSDLKKHLHGRQRPSWRPPWPACGQVQVLHRTVEAWAIIGPPAACYTLPPGLAMRGRAGRDAPPATHAADEAASVRQVLALAVEAVPVPLGPLLAEVVPAGHQGELASAGSRPTAASACRLPGPSSPRPARRSRSTTGRPSRRSRRR